MFVRNTCFSVLLLSISAFASASITLESQATFKQDTLSPFDTGTAPIDLDGSHSTANATFTYKTETVGSSPFELKSAAMLEVDIDGRGDGNPGWSSVEASSRAFSQFVDTAFVQGFQPGVAGGVIEFHWVVTGGSEISLDPKIPSVNGIGGDSNGIVELETTAILNPNAGNGIYIESVDHTPTFLPGSNSINSSQPGYFSEPVYFVDWFDGQDFDLFFELATVARLNIFNGDSAGFNAKMDVDYSNTAVLSAIQIYDEDGNILPNATLTSTVDPTGIDYGSIVQVPEPSGGGLLFLLATCYGGLQWCRLRQSNAAYLSQL